MTDDPVRYPVDIAAADDAVERIKAHVRTTFRPEVIGDLGGFGGLFAFEPGPMNRPVLVASTDGVGTKSQIARLTGRYDTIGTDLVAMSVDDLAVQGAQPLFFLDYVSTGKVIPDMIDALVAGVAHGCRSAGCALIGGEISEHPGVMEADDFDLVGFAVGVVARDDLLPQGIAVGDQLIGLASPGLRCNGYALARAVLLDRAGRAVDEPAWDGARHSLGDELLTPSVIYAPALLTLRRQVEVHGFAHITGGGIAANVARVLPDHVDAVLHRSRWVEPRIFAEIRAAGPVSEEEMDRVFNRGLGMVAIVPTAAVEPALAEVRRAGHEAWVVGEIVGGSGSVRIEP